MKHPPKSRHRDDNSDSSDNDTDGLFHYEKVDEQAEGQHSKAYYHFANYYHGGGPNEWQLSRRNLLQDDTDQANNKTKATTARPRSTQNINNSRRKTTIWIGEMI